MELASKPTYHTGLSCFKCSIHWEITLNWFFILVVQQTTQQLSQSQLKKMVERNISIMFSHFNIVCIQWKMRSILKIWKYSKKEEVWKILWSLIILSRASFYSFQTVFQYMITLGIKGTTYSLYSVIIYFTKYSQSQMWDRKWTKTSRSRNL